MEKNIYSFQAHIKYFTNINYILGKTTEFKNQKSTMTKKQIPKR